MIVLGGRTNTAGENVQMEVYETETSEWRKFTSLTRHRHSVWAVDTLIYMHGGFENETPNIPTNSIMKLDLTELFAKSPVLLGKLEQVYGDKAKGSRAKTPTDDSMSSRSNTPPM